MTVIPQFPGHLLKNDGLFLIGAIKPKPYVFCYEQQQVEVVHGPSCRVDREVNIENCDIDYVEIVGRRGGGGTVVLMPGVVVTVVVGERMLKSVHDGGEVHAVFDRIHDAMIGLLLPFVKHDIAREGISDLVIGGRKVLGSSLYLGRTPDFYYYQSSLMVDCECTLMERYLNHPPKEPDYRKGRTHGEFCTSLKQTGTRISAAEVVELFSEKLPGLL